MATIYRARDAQLDRDVAVKLLRPEFGQDPDFLARFRDEARAAASLNHPNIVSVFDFGEDESGPYIVMELVEGQDLASILRGNGAARAAPGGPRRRRGRQGAPGGARPRARPSRRQAVEHPRRPRRPDQGRRLRHRPGRQRGAGHAARHDDGLRPLLQPGAGARRARDRRLRRLRAGHRPVRGAHRAAAVLRRRRRGRSPSRGSPPRRRGRPRSAPGVPPELDAIVTNGRWRSTRPRATPSAAAMAERARGLARPTPATHRPPCRSPPPGAAAATRRGRGRDARGPDPPDPVPYPPDAYARSGPPPVRPPRRPAAAADRDGDGDARTTRATSPWAWIAGLLGIAVLAIIGFLVFRLLTGGGIGRDDPAPSPERVGASRSPSRASWTSSSTTPRSRPATSASSSSSRAPRSRPTRRSGRS